MVAPGLAWAWLDVRVWPWDQAQYAEVTFKTLGAFRDGGDVGFKSMMFLLDFRAPGLTWLSIPYAAVGAFFSRPEPALLCATLTWQLGTVLACYRCSELISQSRLVALAVAAFIAATPLFIGMSHQFFVEPLQTLAVALSFLLALRAKEMSSEALLAALCGVTALGMGAKASFPLYAALPLAYATVVLAGRRSFTPIRAPVAMRAVLHLCATGGLALVALWYITHLGVTFDNVRQSTIGSLALNYGTPGDFVTKLGYWTSSLAVALIVCSPLVLLGTAAGAAVGLAAERGRPASPRPAGAWVVGLAAVHLAAVLVTYSLQINDDTRFLEPLLPIIAIVLAWVCSLRRPLLAASVVLATALPSYVLGYSYALGFSPATRVRHPWLQVAHRDPTQSEQLRQVVALTCDGDKGFFNVVGVDYAWLSHFSANFYAAVAHAGRPGCLYDHLGYATSDVTRALKSLAGRQYYIGMRPEKMPKYVDRHLNLASEAVFAKVAASERWTHVRTIDDSVVIFQAKGIRE